MLTARNWQSGGLEDSVAYRVRPTYFHHFTDVIHLGVQVADWVWLLGSLALLVLLTSAFCLGTSVFLGRSISHNIDDLSDSTRQIAAGHFAWRAPARSDDQLGDLVSDFNSMALSLDRLHKEEAARMRLESELHVASAFRSISSPASCRS